MTQLERLKDELITLTVRRGYPAELGALMAAELGTEKTITRMIAYLTHVAPERAEDMVDEMLAIHSLPFGNLLSCIVTPFSHL